MQQNNTAFSISNNVSSQNRITQNSVGNCNHDKESVATAAAAADQKYVKKWEQHYRQFLTQLQTIVFADGRHTCTAAGAHTQLFVPTNADHVCGDVLSVSSPSYTCIPSSFVSSSFSSNGSTISSNIIPFTAVGVGTGAGEPVVQGTAGSSEVVGKTCLFSLGMRPPRRLLRSTSSDSVLDFPPFYSIRHQSLPMMVNDTVPEEHQLYSTADQTASTAATSTAITTLCNNNTCKATASPRPRSDSDLAPTSVSTSTHSKDDDHDTTPSTPRVVSTNDGINISNHSPLDRQNSAVTRAQSPPSPSKPIKNSQVVGGPMSVSRDAMRELVRIDEPELKFHQRPRSTSDASSISAFSSASSISSKSGKGSFLKNIFKRKKKKKNNRKSDRLVESERTPSERHSIGMLRLNQSDRQKVSALPRNVRSCDCLDRTRWKGDEKNFAKYASFEAPRSIPPRSSSVRSLISQNPSMGSLPGDCECQIYSIIVLSFIQRHFVL